MGYLMINVQLPDSASTERTLKLLRENAGYRPQDAGVGHTFFMSGQSLLLSAFGSNFGSIFLMLTDFSERPQPTTERFFDWYRANRDRRLVAKQVRLASQTEGHGA